MISGRWVGTPIVLVRKHRPLLGGGFSGEQIGDVVGGVGSTDRHAVGVMDWFRYDPYIAAVTTSICPTHGRDSPGVMDRPPPQVVACPPPPVVSSRYQRRHLPWRSTSRTSNTNARAAPHQR